MGKNVVILSGSPRKNATTDRLVRAFVEGAESAGNSVSLFRTADLNIGGCLGCNHCFEDPGACVQRDDMIPILKKLKMADVLVLASPIYYFGLSAQLKVAIDRMYALLSEGMPVRRAALLITCGDVSSAAADSAVSMFRQISDYLKWEEAGVVIAPQLHDPNDIDGRPELKQAKELGKII
ncbi:MAG: flavodoxin family protein [Synergistaceae bacterium]|jgi:multimeric flavodoxin WrbA|nr:flavodoxin family protein [Synergistaceae bacterium]